MNCKHSILRWLPCAFLVALCLAPAAQSQELVDTLTAEPGQTSVGNELAISRNRAVLAVQTPAGRRLRFYEKTSSGWIFDQEIFPAFDGFSFDMDLDGDVFVMAASGSGLARVVVYERQDDGTWFPTTSISHSPSGITKVVLSGRTFAVGHVESLEGVVRVYRDFGAGWEEINEIPGGQDIFYFGSYMDLDGNWLAIGRPDQEQGGGGGGKAGWIEVYRDFGTQYIHTTDIDGGPSMGFSELDLDDNRLFTLDGNPQIFRYNGSSWLLEDELVLPATPGFFPDVILRGDVAVLSTPSAGNGAVYTYAREGTEWNLTGRLVDESGLAGPEFGRAIDLSGPLMLTAGGTDSSLGAQVFDLPLNTHPYGTCPLDVAPCANWTPIAGCVNSTGLGATLRVQGTASVTQDDLVFTMRSLPPNSFGLLFLGGAKDSVVIGDGVRVVGAGATGLFRFMPEQADFAGVLTQGPGLAAEAAQLGGSILAGSVWHYQGWYRDIQGGPCGSGFNLTNGVEVTFEP